ncbi:MAG TPA: ribosome maturation factor RimM [Acidimicrobiia bacterium]|nr:ribosome maturation factor RimM [Acidimicrobiia bacterium]
MAEPPVLEVGRVVKAHGIRGEVVVEAVTNRPERFAAGAELQATDRTFVIRSATIQGGPDPLGRPTRTRWIVGLEGVATRRDAELLRGTVLYGEALGELPDEDEVWVHELIGADVVGLDGTALGRVAAVEANPASDLLVLEAGGLVPMVFVVEAAPGRVVVDPPEGLLDL